MTTGSERRGQVMNGKSLKTAWAGSWGVFRDARSKLSRRAQEIEWELLKEYCPAFAQRAREIDTALRAQFPDSPPQHRKIHPRAEREALPVLTLSPLQRRGIRHAAELYALRDQAASQVGLDLRVTPRRLSAIQKAATAELAPLRALRNWKRVEPSLRELLAGDPKGAR